MTGRAAMSSYTVFGGLLNVVSGSVPDFQTAACWVVITNDGQFAYTTNTASGTVSSYNIGSDGTLTLLNSVAAKHRFDWRTYRYGARRKRPIFICARRRNSDGAHFPSRVEWQSESNWQCWRIASRYSGNCRTLSHQRAFNKTGMIRCKRRRLLIKSLRAD
jgi:hypothetical protein